MRQAFVFFCLFLAVTGCADRNITPVVPDAAEIGQVQTLFAVTNRAQNASGDFTSARQTGNSFLSVDVAIPPDHVPGTVSTSYRRPNPQRHFTLSAMDGLPGYDGFVAAVNQDLQARAPENREIVLFVHGYNNSFADALYRTAQLKADFSVPGTVVTYSWPSRASPVGYTYDHESILFSRDSFEQVLRALSQTKARRVIVVAHSMGSVLLMETLRQIEIAQSGWSARNIDAVALVSPDMGIDMFRKQATRIRDLPSPFVIVTSDRDRVLRLSRQINSGNARLGSDLKAEDVSDLDVIVVDASALDDTEGSGHFVVTESESLLKFLQDTGAVDRILSEGTQATFGMIATSVIKVDNATRFVLTTPPASGQP